MPDHLDADIRALMRAVVRSSIEPPPFPAERLAARRATTRQTPGGEGYEAPPAVPVVDGISSSGRRKRRWVVAVVAALVVLVAAIVPAWMLRTDDTGEAIDASELVLGAGPSVWPENGRPGSPAEVVLAFANEVLGWTDATVSSDPQADPTGPVWVQIQHPGVAEVEALTLPVPSGGRVLVEVGHPTDIGAIEPGKDLGTRVGVVPVPGARSAEVTIRVSDGRHVNIAADQTDLDRFAVDAFEIEPLSIQTILIRYYDGDGQVVAVSGGSYG